MRAVLPFPLTNGCILTHSQYNQEAVSSIFLINPGEATLGSS